MYCRPLLLCLMLVLSTSRSEMRSSRAAQLTVDNTRKVSIVALPILHWQRS